MTMIGAEHIDVPERIYQVGRKRVLPLVQRGIAFDQTIGEIAVSCYLQGFQDAYDALTRKAMTLCEDAPQEEP